MPFGRFTAGENMSWTIMKLRKKLLLTSCIRMSKTYPRYRGVETVDQLTSGLYLLTGGRLRVRLISISSLHWKLSFRTMHLARETGCRSGQSLDGKETKKVIMSLLSSGIHLELKVLKKVLKST